MSHFMELMLFNDLEAAATAAGRARLCQHRGYSPAWSREHNKQPKASNLNQGDDAPGG